jgi:hypothetical protein
MSLAIPNTTTQNTYTAATTFPPEQGAGTPFASGYLVIANNPATVSVLRGRTQGAASWGADFSYAPTTLPISSGLDPGTGQIRDYIFGVRFKSAVPGSAAQVFGGLFQLGDVTLSPANQFTGTLAAGGGFTPPSTGVIGSTATLHFPGGSTVTTLLTVAHGLGIVPTNVQATVFTASFGGDVCVCQTNNFTATSFDIVAQTTQGTVPVLGAVVIVSWLASSQ